MCPLQQVTFQANNIQEARHLYDQLAVVCPVMVRGRELREGRTEQDAVLVMRKHLTSLPSHASLQLALSASAPVFRGYLADIDCRWCVVAGSVDDRTAEERGLKVKRTRCLPLSLFV